MGVVSKLYVFDLSSWHINFIYIKLLTLKDVVLELSKRAQCLGNANLLLNQRIINLQLD